MLMTETLHPMAGLGEASRVGDWTRPFTGPTQPALRPVVASQSGSWSAHAIPLFHGGAATRSATAGDSLTVSLGGLTGVSLVLLRHSWSGSAEVGVGQDTQIHELYSDETDTLDVPVTAQPDMPITLRNLGRTHQAARGAECWLVGFRRHGMLWPIELGEPASRITRLIRGRIGTFLTFRGDTGIADALAVHGVWSEEEMRRFAEYVRPGMTALDVGANFGHHSIALSKLVGSAGRVLAVEPQRLVHHLLCANIAINAAWNVVPVRAAVGEAPGMVRMYPFDYEYGGNIGALGVNPEPSTADLAGEEVALTTLDALVEQNYGVGAAVGFIKIDVQSFELFALRGALRILTEQRPIVQVEVAPVWMRNRGYDHREIRQLLEGLGYTCLDMIPGPKTAAGEYVWDGTTDREWNMLALPPH